MPPGGHRVNCRGMAKKDVPGLICRLAGPDDAEALAAMIADFAAYERMVSLPLYTRMSDADVQRVVQAVRAALG